MYEIAQTTTTTALLDGLREGGNQPAWEEFDARYRPIVVAFGRRCGLGDADDVAQEALLQFAKAYREGKYDRTRGRLRAWLIGITRFRLTDLQRAQAARREREGESEIAQLPDEDRLGEIWDAECRQAILNEGMRQLAQTSRFEEKTLRAFAMLIIDKRPAAEVAAELDMTAQAVYLAKHRCTQRLREIVGTLREAYEIDL